MVSTEPRRKATTADASRLARWLRAAGRAIVGGASAAPGRARWRRQPVRVRTAPRGISLLEVLLSMFILTVGLLGVAALIPVGRYDLNQASQADRGSTVGRAAFREVQIRGMLEPEMWLSPAYDPSVPLNPWYDVDEMGYTDAVPADRRASPLELGNSVCLDPMFVARAQATSGPILAENWPGRSFPYWSDNDPAGGIAVPRMARATLKAWPDQNVAPLAPPLALTAADRIFRWQDDVVFQPVAQDEAGRPAQVFDATSTPQFLGDYTWLVTLTPNIDFRAAADPSYRAQSYTASVVVFQRRTVDLAEYAVADRNGLLPTERAVYAEFPFGPGLGTTDVLLRLPAGADNPVNGGTERSDFPAVKAGQWILLCGWLRGDGVVPPLFTGNRMWATFRWYRVTSVDELTPGTYGGNDEWQQYVTVEGPPLWTIPPGMTSIDAFNATYVNADGNTTEATLHAVIVDGVVGVYEKTVQLPE